MSATRTSSSITTSSALVLGAGGIALLFGSDVLLPRLLPGASAGATVLGQLISAGWLALAWLNWNQRRMLVGGIYGRPTVLANLTLYLVSAFSLGHVAMGGDASPVLVVLTVVFGVLAAAYGALLMRGPFGTDTAAEAGSRGCPRSRRTCQPGRYSRAVGVASCSIGRLDRHHRRRSWLDY